MIVLMKIPKEVINDFRNHLFFCFNYLNLGKTTPIQFEIARQIQEGPHDQIIAAGRGTGKSTITACLASWVWLKNPNATFLVLSNAQTKAIDFVSQARKIISLVPYCQHMVPGITHKDNALGFNLANRDVFTQDLSCVARGITGQITGLHSDYIVLDDIEVAGKNETPLTKDTLLRKLSELEGIRNDKARIIFLGTPHFQDSIYNTLKTSYPLIKYPAEAPDLTIPSEKEDVAPWILSLNLSAGEPTQPERFSKDALLQRKAKMGPAAYALQYKLDTSLSDEKKFPLKLRDLLVFDLDRKQAPESVIWQGKDPYIGVPSFGLSGDYVCSPMHLSSTYLPYQHTHMSIDPSGRGGDETGICIASSLSGMVYIHYLSGLQGGYGDAVLHKLVSLAMEYDCRLIRVESNFGDGMFSKLLLPVVKSMGCLAGIDEFRVGGSKERRIIETLEPVVSSHRLVVDRRVISDKVNQIQITRIKNSKGSLEKDDRIDALSSAVSFYRAQMNLDIEASSHKAKRIENERIAKDWLNNFRATDYVPCSGATRIIVSTEQNRKKKQNKSQWGW